MEQVIHQLKDALGEGTHDQVMMIIRFINAYSFCILECASFTAMEERKDFYKGLYQESLDESDNLSRELEKCWSRLRVRG